MRSVLASPARSNRDQYDPADGRCAFRGAHLPAGDRFHCGATADRHTSAGAPNVVVVLLDDVGFGAQGTFGGPVPTPVLDRIAATVSDSRPKSGAAIAAASKPVSAQVSALASELTPVAVM